ncbi:leucine-rich repeat protein [Enorma massiliensis]|uniref:Gram-positive cocci surface proteins LPxTG domain-containing protein n=1 Tax=Enorma massiliensis TaxID=1472761 RepID=A0A1Y3TYV3_9ACTN|nr:leucine-rich repeat protein [Enorma massiliensis]OUN41764.1 hypothetical protein B5G21_08990 [Enorma massiliensis]
METRSIKDIMASSRIRRRWRPIVAVLGVLTVAAVVARLMLPASTAGDNPRISAEQEVILAGEAATVHVRADAEDGQAKTVFALRVVGGGGLANGYTFSENGEVNITDASGAPITDSAGNVIDVYSAPQDENTQVYLFALPEGATAEFDLDFQAAGAHAEISSGSLEDVYEYVDAIEFASTEAAQGGTAAQSGTLMTDAYALEEEEAGEVATNEAPAARSGEGSAAATLSNDEETGGTEDSSPDDTAASDAANDSEGDSANDAAGAGAEGSDQSTDAGSGATASANDTAASNDDGAPITDDTATDASSNAESDESSANDGSAESDASNGAATGEDATEDEAAAPELPVIEVTFGDGEATGTSTITTGRGATAAEAVTNAARSDAEQLELSWMTQDQIDELARTEVAAQSNEASAQSEDGASARSIDLTGATRMDGGDLTGANGEPLSWSVMQTDAGDLYLVISGEGDMPDYTSMSEQPWYGYASRLQGIVVEEGITSVGARAFYNMRASELSLPSTVTAIGPYSFGYNSFVELTIPGNVTTIGNNAFDGNTQLASLTIEEGVQTIGTSAFNGTGSSSLVFRIPASVTNIAGLNTPYVARYEVANGNANYVADEDGVLYQITDSELTLLKYPTRREMVENYTIPSAVDGRQVTALGNGSLQGLQNLQNVVVPASVQSMGSGVFQSSTSLESVVFKDGMSFGSNSNGLNGTFSGCTALTSVTFPSSMTGSSSYAMNSTFYNCHALREVVIPSYITAVTNNPFYACFTLRTITYDAAAARVMEIIADGAMGNITFDLVVGANVDQLRGYLQGNANADYSFSALADYARSISFAPSNAFTIDAGAFSGAYNPLTSDFSGNAWVDANGVLYLYDTETNEAMVAYVPAGLETVAIPGEIVVPKGDAGGTAGTYTVTRVRQAAFCQASDTTAVTFASPEAITTIDPYAFADCTNLERINDATEFDAVKATFPNATFGVTPFYNTKIKGSAGSSGFETEMQGQQELNVGGTEGAPALNISVRSAGDTLTWLDDNPADGLGGYRLLTGDTMTVTAAVSNTSETPNTYRIYLHLNDTDGSINLEPGTTYTFDGVEATCHATEDPATVYLEITPPTGSTVYAPITVGYPNHESDGGGVTIWGVELTQEQAADSENDGLIIDADSNNYIDAFWTTQQDTFSLEKEKASNSNATVVGDEDGTMRPNTNLSWLFTFGHEGGEETSEAFGHDHVYMITFSDTITLPEGINWDPQVLADIQAGNVHARTNTLYAGNTAIAALSHAGGKTTYAFDASYNQEDKTITFEWSLRNADRDAEINLTTSTFNLRPEAIVVDTDVYIKDDDHLIHNSATADLEFYFGENQQVSAEATYSLAVTAGNLTLNKTSGGATYFGEDIDYTLEVGNTGGLAYTAATNRVGEAYVMDELPEQLYIKPTGIQQILDDAAADPLASWIGRASVTIEQAELAPREWTPVKSVDGTDSSYQHVGNSNIDGVTVGNTIEITRVPSDGYQAVITPAEGEPSTVTASTVEELLQQIGYAPTSASQYICRWYIGDGHYTEDDRLTIPAGRTFTLDLPATVKDSFMILGEDWMNRYNNETMTFTNTAHVCVDTTNSSTGAVTVNNIESAGTRSRTNTVRREAIITKSVSSDGATLGDSFSIENGSILDYTFEFTHYGSEVYENLPMVDDLYGTQYLLVPVELNTGNTTLVGRDTVQGTDGTSYYKLDEGIYTNVVVGTDANGNNLTAATITVAPDSGTVDGHAYEGLHTQVKWYYETLGNANGQTLRHTVTYKTIVDTASTVGDDAASYVVGNIIWMNDRVHRRLYDGTWGGGTVVEYDKNIVTDRGKADDPTDDVDDTDKHSVVAEGQRVTYRIDLENNSSSYRYTFPGTSFYDMLPETYGVFDWTRGGDGVPANIEVQWVTTGGATVQNGDSWTVSDQRDATTDPVVGQQYLHFDDVSITYPTNSAVYLYVTLTFPEDSSAEGGAQTWTEFATANAGAVLYNTAYTYGFPATVSHELDIEGRVLLQKGVYSTMYNANATNYYFTDDYDRTYYHNRDYRYRQVAYYVVLYNGSAKRLYLDTLYDQLPDGFSYAAMTNTEVLNNGNVNSISQSSVVTGTSGNALFTDVSGANASAISYRSARVTAAYDEASNTVQFDFSDGTGDSAVSYDEDSGRYYLGNNEAIVFGVVCRVGEAAETDDLATNTIAMPYANDSGTATSIVTDDEIIFSGAETSVNNVSYSDTNDGESQLLSSDQVEQQYNFTDESGAEQWIVSDVSLQRGEIRPGITKSTASFTSTEGTTHAYDTAISPGDTVNWEVNVYNDGNATMFDYVVEDIMPAPFVFEGDVYATVYNESDASWQARTRLFTVTEHELGADTITVQDSNNAPIDRELTRGGNWTNLTGGNTFEVKYDVVDGNEVFYIRFISETSFSIPEGGHMLLEFSSRNPTTTHVNTSYTNVTRVTPTQEFTQFSNNGTPEYDENKNPVSSTHSSQVTVAFGYATSSEKHVQNADGSKRASSTETGSGQYITLDSTQEGFRYTLQVNNATDEAMTKLVLIDNLPEAGDTDPFGNDAQRGSNFTVSLADNPDFQVLVTPEDGEPTQLDNQYYQIQYSSDTDFGGPMSADWAGETTGTTANWVDDDSWTSPLSKVRSIRIIITDEGATQIPAHAVIAVSFGASAPDTVEVTAPVAWNNFGYHYAIRGVEQELEAMSDLVGVRVPSVPRLQKQLVDNDGSPLAAETDEAFSFVIYEGEELAGSYATQEELIQALRAASCDYAIETVEVKAGESESGWVFLNDAAEALGLTDGSRYTVAEFPEGGWTADSMNADGAVSNDGSATFTYDANGQNSITCVNRLSEWTLQLSKVNGTAGEDQSPLEGAVFALYTADPTDGVLNAVPDEYAGLGIELKVTRSGTAGEVTWYLKDIQTTPPNGQIAWAELNEDSYGLLEVAAPDGYNLPAEPWNEVDRPAAGGTTTVEFAVHNTHGFLLPESGGFGTRELTIFGAVLMAGAGAAMLARRRTRRE